jgi:acetyltransferase
MQTHNAHALRRISYPAHLISCWRLVGGRRVTLRPVHPEDEELEQSFVRSLSSRTRYYRFFNAIRELAPETLWRLTHVDYQRSMTLLAVVQEAGHETQVGVAEYVTDHDTDVCEFALVVHDAWQGEGIGSLLLDMLEQCARAAGLSHISGDVIADNQPMLRLAKSHGFEANFNVEDSSLMRLSKTLAKSESSGRYLMSTATSVPCIV